MAWDTAGVPKPWHLLFAPGTVKDGDNKSAFRVGTVITGELLEGVFCVEDIAADDYYIVNTDPGEVVVMTGRDSSAYELAHQICHCGTPIAEHNQFDNHSPVAMESENFFKPPFTIGEVGQNYLTIVDGADKTIANVTADDNDEDSCDGPLTREAAAMVVLALNTYMDQVTSELIGSVWRNL